MRTLLITVVLTMSGDGITSIDGGAYTLRTYQTEMVEASLKQNVIVAVIF